MKTKLSILLTAGLLAACSSDNETQPEAPVRHIRVVVNERPMISNEAKVRGAETRAEITTTSTLNGFTMYGIFNGSHKYTVTKNTDDNTWLIDPKGWIIDDDIKDNTVVPFYAYTTNGSCSDFYPKNGIGDAYVNFTVYETASEQHDLLVAHTSAAYAGHNGEVGTVSLTFDHACAAVNFNVQMTNKLATDERWGSNTLTVTSIKLNNVYNTGKYSYESSSDKKQGWNDLGYGIVDYQPKPPTYTLTNSNITVTTEPKALPCNSLFMIPQTRTAKDPFDVTTDVYLEVTYKINNEAEQTWNIPMDVNWKAGTEYTINIKLGTTLIKNQ